MPEMVAAVNECLGDGEDLIVDDEFFAAWVGEELIPASEREEGDDRPAQQFIGVTKKRLIVFAAEAGDEIGSIWFRSVNDLTVLRPVGNRGKARSGAQSGSASMAAGRSTSPSFGMVTRGSRIVRLRRSCSRSIGILHRFDSGRRLSPV